MMRNEDTEKGGGNEERFQEQQGSNRQINRGINERKKEGNTYCKDNGSTTPWWAKTHTQKDMATLHDTPISLIMSGLQMHEQSQHG